jgi:hypothetical protein
MEINIPKLYLMFHNQGVPGSWFGWFINQHTNFPKWDFNYLYGNPIAPNLKKDTKIVKYPMHMSCDPVLWNCKELNDLERSSSLLQSVRSTDKITTLEEHYQTYKDLSSDSFSKVLLKFENLHQPERFVQTGIHKIKESNILIEKIISIKSGNNVITLNKILNRLYDLTVDRSYTKADLYKKQFKIMEENDINIYYPALEGLAPVHVADFSKLLACDENEYNKLLTAINEKPLDNWKDHVQVIASILDRYK